MEVTSTSGEVEAINWRGPDDNNKTHEVSDSGEPIETPWSERIEVASERGVIVLTALAPLGATATCRLLVGDKVLAEESGRPIASCMVTPQRAFPAS
ncbi:hypothetical protein BDK92_0135 [Micromonospora pisi]|uniref:Uncharacterized protein n=2 Tax=Micromonospora pisi TaxID=589240 RepID=A0A495JCX7_9ACTN|nr:hypothetical protein BDK92_0135 [Micromonospora pisi]